MIDLSSYWKFEFVKARARVFVPCLKPMEGKRNSYRDTHPWHLPRNIDVEL